jgi:hypothetical protein
MKALKLMKGAYSYKLNGKSINIRPFGTDYKGAIWSRKIDFGSDFGFVTIFIPTDPYAKGAVKVYDENGKLLQMGQPFGGYTKTGFNVSLTIDSMTDKVFLALGMKGGGRTVRVYEVTSAKLRGVDTLTLGNVKGNVVPAFLKMYSDASGLATMANGKKTTLRAWRYNAGTGHFTRDTAFGMTRLKVRGNAIQLK